MIKQIKLNLRATKVFFFVRFVFSLLIGFVYIFIAANVQYLFVSILGESTFNYIMGGILSLMAGVAICGLLSRLVFMFVRGWHMAALAYAPKIIKKHLSPLDAGMTVFKKHFSSFAIVYGASVAMRKAADCASDNLWDLLEDVPFLNSLRRFADNPIVSKVAKDILDTAFDAAVFYAVKYTKPGVVDDVQVIGTALKKYLFALPQIVIASLTSFLLFYVLPKVAAFMLILYMFMHEGFVAGILICVLLYPVFFIVRNSLFNPLETIILISGFAKYCKEETEESAAENESVYGSIVNSILEELGLDLGGDSDDEEETDDDSAENDDDTDAPEEEPEAELVKTKVRPTPKSRSGKPPVRKREEQKVAVEQDDASGELELAVEPTFEEESSDSFEIVQGDKKEQQPSTVDEVLKRQPAQSGGSNLASLLAAYQSSQSLMRPPATSAPVEKPEEEEEEETSPIEVLSSGLSGLSGSQLADMLNASEDGDEDDDGGDSGSMFDDMLGGGNLDVF